MTWDATDDTVKDLLASKLEGAEITSVELTYVSRSSAIANAFLDLIAQLVQIGLQELTLKKFPNTLELDPQVL